MPDPSPTRPLRIALAHDWLVGPRGGEQVLEQILRHIEERHELAGLYTMFCSERSIGPRVDRAPKTVSTLGSLPGSNRARRWLLPLYPAAVADLSRTLARDHTRRPIDLLISTSSAAVKGVRAPAGVPHLCYIHSPPRYLWGQQHEYQRHSLLRRAGLSMLGPWLRHWDTRTSQRVSRFVANSTYTAGEVQAAYGRRASILHPPVDTSFFTPREDTSKPRRSRAWLVVSALEPYKRVDVAIDAANSVNNPLWIVGGGSQKRLLVDRAGPSVTFLGWLDRGELRDRMRRARVLLFPQVEDFGIAAVEALACGLPVAARAQGGALDYVDDGVNGAVFHTPLAHDVVDACARCPEPDSPACRQVAERFSEPLFQDGIAREIARAMDRAGDSIQDSRPDAGESDATLAPSTNPT